MRDSTQLLIYGRWYRWSWIRCMSQNVNNFSHMYISLECGTWFHHPRRLQCVKFSKSQRDIIDAVTISKIIVFEIICNVAYYSAAKFTFSIEQPSNKATKCGIRGSWKLKVKPNLGCCSNIAITISYISVFVSSWQSPNWPSYGRLSDNVNH